MALALATTALVMGLAGGVHCTAMCGAACAGLSRLGSGSQQISGRLTNAPRSMWSFQFGRLAGYTIAGAAAAQAVEALAWLTSSTAALRPVWTLFHAGVLTWGLMLLVLARQPGWVSEAGRTVWTRVRPLAGARGGLFGAGLLWAFMPCGLLYSALLVASLSGGAAEGALSMALFATGSGAWLVAAPRLAAALRRSADRVRHDWGTRASGLLLMLAATWALWMDLAHRIALWCGIA